MTEVSELIVLVFTDRYRASEVLNALRRRDWEWVASLNEAVVVALDEDGRAKVQLSVDLTTHEEVVWARLWGSFIKATLFLPAADVIVEAAGLVSAPEEAAKPAHINQAASPDPGWWRERLRLSDDFIRDVGATMVPGASAIFMRLRAHDRLDVLRQLRNYGGTVLRAALDPEQDREMQTVLSGG